MKILQIAGAGAFVGLTLAVSCDHGRILTNKDTVCICESSYSGALCDGAYTSPDSCASWDDAEAQTRDISTGSSQATLGTLVSDSYVQWTVSIPISNGRTYTNFKVGTCNEGASLQTFVPSASSCNDQWVFSMPVVSLTACGFSYDNVTYLGNVYANYTDQIVFTYSENTVVASNTVARTATVVLPTTVLVLSQVTAVADSINVNSQFSIDTALTGQSITPGASSSSLILSYVLSLPYTVLSMGGALTETGTDNVATLCSEDNGAGTCGSPVMAMVPCNISDFTGQVNNGCLREAYIKIVHSQCTLTGSYEISNVVIDCAPDLAEADCPINQADGSTTITFTLTSENFCNGIADPQTIDGAVVVERFIFVDPENRKRDAATWEIVDSLGATVVKPAANTPITALEWSKPFYGRVDFSGLAVTAVNLVSTGLKIGASSVFVNADTAPTVDTSTTLTPGTDYTQTRPNGYEASLTCAHLGLCANDQSYLAKYILSADLHSSLADPGLGNTLGLIVRHVLDVSYQTDGSFAASRRRRRQAQTGAPIQDGIGSTIVNANGEIQGTEKAADVQTNGANSMVTPSFVILVVGILSMTMAI